MTAEDLAGGRYDRVILATGVRPRAVDIAGHDHPMVCGYADVLGGRVKAGLRVAIIGAGGIGFDVAEFLTHGPAPDGPPEDRFLAEWGIDTAYRRRGGLAPDGRRPAAPERTVWLLQRKASKVGRNLGKTTGWIHRAVLQRRGVTMLAGVAYRRIDDAGLHITHGGRERLLDVDTVVVCAGQEPRRDLLPALAHGKVPVDVVGGADVAAELDAKRAIDQATRLAAAV